MTMSLQYKHFLGRNILFFTSTSELGFVLVPYPLGGTKVLFLSLYSKHWVQLLSRPGAAPELLRGAQRYPEQLRCSVTPRTLSEPEGECSQGIH